jgi:hypothetical protein
MKVTNYNDPFPHIIVDDLYNQNELNLIWEELNFICRPNKMQIPNKSESAFEGDDILKKSKMIWVDQIYTDRKYSNILDLNRKTFTTISHDHWLFKNFPASQDCTLISYYENENYYEKHVDAAVLTCLTWFYKEPKRFGGGDVIFSIENKEKIINVKNNKCVIFPSMIHHAVTNVTMEEKYTGKLNGRICMSQFLTYGVRDKYGNYI